MKVAAIYGGSGQAGLAVGAVCAEAPARLVIGPIAAAARAAQRLRRRWRAAERGGGRGAYSMGVVCLPGADREVVATKAVLRQGAADDDRP
jgi:hypothetical protein